MVPRDSKAHVLATADLTTINSLVTKARVLLSLNLTAITVAPTVLQYVGPKGGGGKRLFPAVFLKN